MKCLACLGKRLAKLWFQVVFSSEVIRGHTNEFLVGGLLSKWLFWLFQDKASIVESSQLS